MNNILSSVMNIISAVLSVYMILIIIRVFLTWFHGNMQSRPIQYLIAVVDPYLNFFRRITWLRAGAVDFSPIVAIMLLGLVTQMAGYVGRTGQFSFALLLILILQAIYSLFTFILNILIAIMVIRFVSTFFRRGNSQIWFVMDNILNRVMPRILGVFTQKPVAMRPALAICASVLLVIRIGLYYGYALLVTLISQMGV